MSRYSGKTPEIKAYRAAERRKAKAETLRRRDIRRAKYAVTADAA